MMAVWKKTGFLMSVPNWLTEIPSNMKITWRKNITVNHKTYWGAKQEKMKPDHSKSEKDYEEFGIGDFYFLQLDTEKVPKVL